MKFIRQRLYPIKVLLLQMRRHARFIAFYKRNIEPNKPVLTFDDCKREFTEKKDALLLNLFRDRRNVQVLDVGCNDGSTSIYYGDFSAKCNFPSVRGAPLHR